MPTFRFQPCLHLTNFVFIKLPGKAILEDSSRFRYFLNMFFLFDFVRCQFAEGPTHVRPSKLVTCLNDDGCFEGVPSLATVLASFEAWGIATRHRHAFAK